MKKVEAWQSTYLIIVLIFFSAKADSFAVCFLTFIVLIFRQQSYFLPFPLSYASSSSFRRASYDPRSSSLLLELSELLILCLNRISLMFLGSGLPLFTAGGFLLFITSGNLLFLELGILIMSGFS